MTPTPKKRRSKADRLAALQAEVDLDAKRLLAIDSLKAAMKAIRARDVASYRQHVRDADGVFGEGV